MEEALIGLAGGGGISALSILYTIWQTKKNTEEIDEMNKIIDMSIANLSEFRQRVAEKYVPVGRFVALENKIDKIYEHILKFERV